MGYRVTVTLPDGQERCSAIATDFGDANRWAMNYLLGLEAGREAWVINCNTELIVTSYITGSNGMPRVSDRIASPEQVLEAHNRFRALKGKGA